MTEPSSLTHCLATVRRGNSAEAVRSPGSLTKPARLPDPGSSLRVWGTLVRSASASGALKGSPSSRTGCLQYRGSSSGRRNGRACPETRDSDRRASLHLWPGHLLSEPQTLATLRMKHSPVATSSQLRLPFFAIFGDWLTGRPERLDSQRSGGQVWSRVGNCRLRSSALCHMRNRTNEPLLFNHTASRFTDETATQLRGRAHGLSSDTPRTDPVEGPNATSHTELSVRHVKMHPPCPAHGRTSAFCTYWMRVLVRVASHG